MMTPPGADINPLPQLDDFSEDEELVARFVVGAIRSGGTMFEGRIYECRVMQLLGGDLPPRGVWPWDVRLRDDSQVENCTRIEVRSGATSFSLKGGRDVHVWVFVRKGSGAPGAAPHCYYVAPDSRVAALRNEMARLTLARAEVEAGRCSEDGLKAAVARASTEERLHCLSESRAVL